jgi:hypothetical protein
VKKKKASKFVAPKPTAKKATTSFLSSSSKPVSREGSSKSGDGSNFLLTAAERKKLNDKEKKRAEEKCFDFLVDIKDKEGNRPGDPDYDPRTVYIPKSSWKEFTPFETQFWEIKQNHYDTVLFFQKGKFYELYENDAMIGHQEFDLKLTDRVKMKMVSFRHPGPQLTSGRRSRAVVRVLGGQVPWRRIQGRQGRAGRDCDRHGDANQGGCQVWRQVSRQGDCAPRARAGVHQWHDRRRHVPHH